jgi:hypothetical protein
MEMGEQQISMREITEARERIHEAIELLSQANCGATIARLSHALDTLDAETSNFIAPPEHSASETIRGE